MTRISIVVPVQNREDLLPETLNSVLSQTFTDWECIIVDDHSTDSSLKVAENYASKDERFRAISLPDPKRYANAARNYGLSLAHGEFINFLDSDDLFAPEKLSLQMKVFETHVDVQAVNCRYARFAIDPAIDAYQVCFAPQDQSLEFLLANEQVYVGQTGCVLWKKCFVESIGGWDESNPGGAWQDPDIFIRAILSGSKVIRLEYVLYFLRRGNFSRLTNRPIIQRDQILHKALYKSWMEIEMVGRDNSFLRYLCADNFYHIAWHRIRDGDVISGLKTWFQDSRAVGQSWPRTIVGAIILLGNRYRWINPIGRRLRPIYFKHRKKLPSPLPYLNGIPISPPEK